jgi:trehalose/maltose transport system substrate-binding protein
MHLCRSIIFSGFIVLIGCGSPPHPKAPVKLTMLGLTSEAGDQLKQDAIDQFTRDTGVQVDLIPTLGNSSEQTALILKLMERRDGAPDVYVIDLIWPGTLEQHLLDLTPYLTEESRLHLPAMLETGMIGKRMVSLPFYMSAGMLYYRKDLLKAYGYAAPPGTWEELARVARHIQQSEREKGRKDFWGYVWQGGAYEGLTCNALEWQTSFGGGRIVESTGAVSLNNPRAIQAMKTAASWIGSISPASVLSYTETDTLNNFRSGNAAFIRNWSSAFQSAARTMPPDSIGLARLPAGPGGRAHTVGGFLLAVSRYSAHPREAAALVLHLTSAAVQRRRALSRGFLPTYAHLYQHPDLVRIFPAGRTLAEAGLDNAVLRPSIPSGSRYAELSKAYYETVHEILAGTVRAEPGFAALETRLKDLMGVVDQRRRD